MKVLIEIISSIIILVLLVIEWKIGYARVISPIIACVFVVGIGCDIFFRLKERKNKNKRDNEHSNECNDERE